jgi:hypothetical protein
VIKALALLREHPEAQANALERFDQSNALLQALRQRWEARIGTRPKSARTAIRDIDATVLAAEQTFDDMESLSTRAGLPEGHWLARRQALERTLMRPIKAYRAELLPHLKRSDVADDEESGEPEAASPQVEGADSAANP